MTIILTLFRCGRRRVVLRKGHIGYNLYFIYSGAVSVVLDKDDGNVFVKPEVVILTKGACFGVSIHVKLRKAAYFGINILVKHRKDACFGVVSFRTTKKETFIICSFRGHP